MFFTLFYMYATLLQWWRLGSLKNKLNGTLNSQNALLVCNESVIFETKKSRSFENLLFRSEDRVGCTIVPRQKISLTQWVTFPKDSRYFPIYINNTRQKIESPNIYILVQAMLESYEKHSAEILQVENFGELIAWKIADHFEAILKTDIDKLTKLVHCYSQSAVDINHELKLLRIETIDIDGAATRIKYDRMFSTESTLKYSYAPVHWKKFVEGLKEIYCKIRDTTPKITIENGATKPEDIRKVPVSEVKPIKKDSKKSEDKNTLEVGASDFRRHKTNDHKRDKSSDKHAKADALKSDKDASKTKEEHKHKEHKIGRADKEVKSKEDKERHHHHHHRKDVKDEETKKDSKEEKDGVKVVKEQSDSKKGKETTKVREHHHKKEAKDEADKVKEHHQHKKDRDTKTEKPRSKNDLEQPSGSSDKPVEEKSKESKALNKRSTSSEKKLVKSAAVCEEIDGEVKEKSEPKSNESKSLLQIQKKTGGVFVESNGHFSESNGSTFSKYKGVKPPNILVYADSPIAKDNVKAVLSTILNKDKYIIYDLPTNPNQIMWNGSTVLVVVCGTVPPNMTFHLLQYLLSGGQLLCLCSDLLYSVLHTFTTAEVREHELVRFTYGKWKQVKMMHHIFCYQASPAKKQFSKDSDHSNPSSGNGSSPIAPRTPSAVEIQHNGKEYTIQVQVLGTEETWQTPSLLLATVKGGEGRAIFSQVHLEINPNQYEDDENKFAALKDSDQARMEILKDILSNHLDVDCSTVSDVNFTPAYFLGRHDLKLNLLSNCDSIKDSSMVCEKITIKFCGKDEKSETPTSSFLPVFIHSCPSNFSTVNYFEALETEHIGRLVLYCDVLASSQHVLDKTLTHGIVVIPRQQTRGEGRSSNVWISPIGSANFSMQLHIPVSSPLGKVLPVVQHLVMVAIVHAIRKVQGCQDLEIGIKWPNDLYAKGNVKIGGLIANSSINDAMAVVNVGAGINLDNANPTICVNDLIRTSNMDKGTSIKLITYEAYFAVVFNEIEKLLKEAQSGNIDEMYDLYYKYWLHNNSVITVTSKEGEKQQVKITGIDDFGFLKVRCDDGAITTVQPDGNTFDMLKGLISPKTF